MLLSQQFSIVVFQHVVKIPESRVTETIKNKI